MFLSRATVLRRIIKHERCSSSSSLGSTEYAVWLRLKSPSTSHSMVEQKSLLDAVFSSKNLQSKEDWYNVGFRDLNCTRGATQLVRRQYGSSVAKAVASVYPEHPWLPWRFKRLPKEFWDDPANQILWAEWIRRDILHGKTLDSWYAVTTAQLRRQPGGASMLRRFQYSLLKLLDALYPKHPWNPTLFAGGVSRGYWSNPHNQRAFLDQVAQELGITNANDWLKVTSEQIVQRPGGSRFLELYSRSVVAAVESVYGLKLTKVK